MIIYTRLRNKRNLAYMRRLLCCSVFIIVTIASHAQVKLGLQLNPTVSSNRFETLSDTVNISNNGSKLKFKFGPIVDIPITETYYFSTGILYAPKQASLKVENRNTGVTTTELYNLQYLQIPLALKLFTNEIALDTKLYFSLGTIAEIKIHEKADKKEYIAIENFSIVDVGLLLAAGVEYNIGLNTVLFGGLSYNRGLANAITDHIALDEDISMKNDLLSLDLGIKF